MKKTRRGGGLGRVARTPVPDVLVAADGRTFAVRGANGRLAFHRTGSDTFATREWLAADADGRDVNDKGLGDGIAYDPQDCIGSSPMGVSSPTSSLPTLSRKIAAAPRSWSPAARRCRTATPR
jgi:hypothetical protein